MIIFKKRYLKNTDTWKFMIRGNCPWFKSINTFCVTFQASVSSRCWYSYVSRIDILQISVFFKYKYFISINSFQVPINTFLVPSDIFMYLNYQYLLEKYWYVKVLILEKYWHLKSTYWYLKSVLTHEKYILRREKYLHWKSIDTGKLLILFKHWHFQASLLFKYQYFSTMNHKYQFFPDIKTF